MRVWLPIALLVLAASAACGGDGSSGGGASEAADVDTDSKPDVTVPQGQDPPDDLVVEDVVVGDGQEVQRGDAVAVHYVGVAWSDGEEFDASWDRGSPLPFTVGEGRVIEGWDEGLVGMREGGRRRLVIPPDMAYGSQGAGDVIGPDETLVFVVDLVEVQGS